MAPTYTRCRMCSRLLLWCITRSGRRLALDAYPAEDGVVVIERLGDGTLRGRAVTGDEMPTGQVAYVPHRSTCPAAEDARQRAAAGVPRCQVCRGRLDDWLVGSGYVRHVGCLAAPRPDAGPVPERPIQGDLFEAEGGCNGGAE